MEYAKAKWEGSFKISAKRRVGKSLTEKLKSPPFSLFSFSFFVISLISFWILTVIHRHTPHTTAFPSFSLWFLQSWGTNSQSLKFWQTPLSNIDSSFHRFLLFFDPTKCMLWRRKSLRGSPASSLIPPVPNPPNHRPLILILRFLFLSSVCSVVMYMMFSAWIICWNGCVIRWHCAFLWVFGYGINDFV